MTQKASVVRVMCSVALLLVMIACLANQSYASPLFTATIDSPGSSLYMTQQDSTAVQVMASSSIPIGVSGGSGSDTKNEFAGAGPGGLRASSRATVTTRSDPGVEVGGFYESVASADATMQFNDLRVSGPGNSAQGSLNLSLSGTGATNANAFFMVDQPGMTATTLSSATIAVSVTLSEEFFPFTVTGGEASFTQTRDSNGNVTGSLFDSGQISIPLNFASTFGKYQLKILLHSYVDASYSSSADNVDLLADALSDYSHTLTFPASGPVFNLPAGYTANSPDAHIVNNMFVPEPGSLVLLVSAGSLIWSGAHRGRRRPSRR